MNAVNQIFILIYKQTEKITPLKRKCLYGNEKVHNSVFASKGLRASL